MLDIVGLVRFLLVLVLVVLFLLLLRMVKQVVDMSERRSLPVVGWIRTASNAIFRAVDSGLAVACWRGVSGPRPVGVVGAPIERARVRVSRLELNVPESPATDIPDVVGGGVIREKSV